MEDERLVARNMAEVLSEFGYRVTTVATGEAAILVARENVPDAILMDIRLAGEIDGVTAARRIREERDVPIVYLTAYSDDETLRRTMQTQPAGYRGGAVQLVTTLCEQLSGTLEVTRDPGACFQLTFSEKG